MIPRIIHQTWKSRTGLPENLRVWHESFREQNPEMELRLYDDADNRALLQATFPTLLPLYDSFPAEIFRADFIRPIYLFKYGGYYADLDFHCLRPLAELEPLAAEIILGQMGTDVEFRHSIPNAFMASAPGQGFWLGYLAVIEKSWELNRQSDGIEKRPEWVAGPVALKNAAMTYLKQPKNFRQLTLQFIRNRSLPIDPGTLKYDPIHICPGHLLYPLVWTDEIHRRFTKALRESGSAISTEEARKLFPKSIAVTYWSGTWSPDRI